jgi:hypothetical protein
MDPTFAHQVADDAAGSQASSGKEAIRLPSAVRNGQPDAPAIAIASPKQHGVTHKGAIVYALADKPQHSLGEDEADVLVQPS